MNDKDSKLLWEAYDRNRKLTRFVDQEHAEDFQGLFSAYITNVIDDQEIMPAGKVQFDLEPTHRDVERAVDAWLYERGGGHIEAELGGAQPHPRR